MKETKMANTIIHHAHQPHTVMMPTTQTVHYNVGLSAAENLSVSKAKTSGWIQMICGFLSILLGIIAIVIEACNAYSATPIWCGLMFYCPAGLLGVLASKKKSQCPIIGCMVMSILSATCSVTHFAVNLSGALKEENGFYCTELYKYWWYADHEEDKGGKLVVNGVLTLIAATEFVCSIYASAVMCGGTSCCHHSTPNTTVTYIPGQASPHVVQAGYPTSGTYAPPGNYPTQTVAPGANYANTIDVINNNYPPPTYNSIQKPM